MSVKTVHCKGTPYQIGFAHGEAVAKQVHSNVATYTAFFDETAKITWAEGRRRAVDQFLPPLTANYPAILEEMQGIADGAGGGLTRDDILTLNVRSEIALTNYTDGCTSLSQVEDTNVFLAQNWDWLEELQQGMVVLDIEPAEDGSSVSRFVFLGEAGIVGKIGMNAAGFGLCMNAIRSGAYQPAHLPVHVMSRRLLQYAHNVDDAVKILSTMGVASTTNYMFADKDGRHADYECSPHGHIVRIGPEANRAFVAHTNHLYGDASSYTPPMVDHPAANSFSRLARMQELSGQDRLQKVPTTFATLRTRFSDEQGYPYSICRGRPPGSVGMERMVTLCNIMMELTSLTGAVVLGRPCEANAEVIKWALK